MRNCSKWTKKGLVDFGWFLIGFDWFYSWFWLVLQLVWLDLITSMSNFSDSVIPFDTETLSASTLLLKLIK